MGNDNLSQGNLRIGNPHRAKARVKARLRHQVGTKLPTKTTMDIPAELLARVTVLARNAGLPSHDRIGRGYAPGPSPARGARTLPLATVYLNTFTLPWLNSLIYALYSLAR